MSSYSSRYATRFMSRHDDVLSCVRSRISPVCQKRGIELFVDLPNRPIELPNRPIELPNRKKNPEKSEVSACLRDVLRVQTRQRPDMILVDRRSLTVSVAELTCCNPGNASLWAREKREKYRNLVRAISAESGMTATLWTIEVEYGGGTYGLDAFLMGALPP